MTEDYTREAVRTIRRNAGHVAPEKLAADLGWTVPRLQRAADRHEIDLRMLAEPVEDPATRRKRVPSSERKTESFTIHLCPSDAAIIIAKAHMRFAKPARLLGQVIEGAIARGKLDDLASAATTYRPIEEPSETPDREGQ